MRLDVAIAAGVVGLALVTRAGTNDLAVARQALRDGLWEIARLHVGTNGTEEARLIVLESLAGEGKWKEIAERLKDWKEAKGDGFDYYRAVVRGDHAAAMAILRKGGTRAGCVEADLYEAGELAKAGRREEAERLWRTVIADTNVSQRAFALASANLMDVASLRKAYAEVESVSLRRLVGLRLGMALLRETATEDEGEKIIRAIVKDSPDAEGAKESFLAVADAQIAAARWKEALDAYREAIEIWPDAGRLSLVHESRGWALTNLGRREEALEAFKRAGEMAADDETKARAGVKVGDVLQMLGRSDEAMSAYRAVLERFPKTEVSRKLKDVVAVRELERKGRELYRNLKYAEAADVFSQVSKADESRRPTMDFYSVLCLYGQGRDDEASVRAKELIAGSPSADVRREASLWLAKFLYNRREWTESGRLFALAAKDQPDVEKAADALLWAARAALAEEDFARTIQLTSQIVEARPESKSKPRALLVQGEALVGQARFDEAVLVLERVAVSESATTEDRARGQMLKADALYAMGADNSSRYVAALEAYRAIGFGGRFSSSEQIVVSFKTARTLEKLKRLDEALDLYYAQVVLAYREARQSNQRLSEEARAAFSRAAFRLADEYESRGRDLQAVGVLRQVETSDVPAADEAAKRIRRIYNKGNML